METETIDRLFLELAQVTSAETPTEALLRTLLRRLLPFVREPGLTHPTTRLEYQRLMELIQLQLAKPD